ncbi:MAG: hypothetical protein JWR63_142 [Conexibacter sp.]|nr:hypothetical protein [Conexibacter sp.]
MAPRLPSIARLARELKAVEWAKRQTVEKSLNYLIQHRSDLDAFAHPEDLGVAAYEEDRMAVALGTNLDAVRNAVLEELWRREIFLGPEVLDQLLFFSLKDPDEPDPLVATLEFLRDRRVTRPGLIIFPLHSIGILRAGLLRGNRKAESQFIEPDRGVAVTPQTNVLEHTIDFIDRTRIAFGVRKPIDPELIRHWRRSRAPWLEFNPLLALRLTSQRGSYFDTEPVVLSAVRAATARLAMISTLQAGHPDRTSRLFSTSSMNNWETLDIHHYIVFADNPAQTGSLEGDCVPIQSRRHRVVELSDLSIEIDPNFKGRRATVAKIDRSVDLVYHGHLAHMWRRRRNAQTRTHDRLFAALSYFLRSFHGDGRSWSAAVSLSTAFEMILTDSYSAGATRRLKRRLALVLRGVNGRSQYEAAFATLYSARGDLVHAGTDPTGLDLHLAQQAFVQAFVVLAPRVASLPTRTSRPMLALTGDQEETEDD